MNKLTPIAFLACLTFTMALVLGPAFGQNKEDEHAAHHPGDKPTAAAPAQPNAGQSKGPATMQQMQDNMKKMHELMARIESSHDPSERRTLLQQHLQAMHAQMGMMHEMGGGMTMGMMDKGGNAGVDGKGTMKGGQQSGTSRDDMMKCHQMMEGRMDMMQMMMEQMIQHEAAKQDDASGD